MRKVVTLSMGLLARLLSTLCQWYGDWLLQKILGQEWDIPLGFLSDLFAFAEWVMDAVAERFCQGFRYREQWN